MLSAAVVYAAWFAAAALGQTNTFPASGNVGIGTTTPGTPLAVIGVTTTKTVLASGQLAGSEYSSGTYADFDYSPAGVRIFPYNFSTGSPAGNVLLSPYGGGVGIGTTAPAFTLDVNGPSRVASNGFNEGGALGGVTFESQAYPNQGSLLFASDGTGYTFMIGNKKLANGSATVVPILTMYDYGRVGIGTTTPCGNTSAPANCLLSVNGAIQAKEVVVNTGWSDYVFGGGYRLAPLSEVAAYIAENHHLPEIPTAAEVAEKGVSLGEMQAKLLAKIEELTLHMIAAEQENSRLGVANREATEQNRALQERVARLEAMVEASVERR